MRPVLSHALSEVEGAAEGFSKHEACHSRSARALRSLYFKPVPQKACPAKGGGGERGSRVSEEPAL
jgi:hypothetical protein